MKVPKLVYVVEDDRITATITGLIAKKDLHCRVVQTFGNGQQAFAKLTAAVRDGVDIPDLVLLDLNMPLMDGWEFLDAFNSLVLTKQVCIFILTSSIHPDDMEKARHYHAVKGYFSKPLDTQNVARMKTLLREIGICHY